MVEQEHKRYPGTRPFLDDKFDRMLFKGRKKEIQQLLHLILAENLVVLFAKSGVGKSSLLNAGVFQPLREKNYFPIRIRMNDPNSNFIDIIDSEAKLAAEECSIDSTSGDKDSLWQYFKTAEFWSENDTLLTPVLVFDQFEEIFTLGYTEKQRKNFFLQLADLVLGRTPESFKKIKVQREKLYSEKPPNIKVVIAMREDFLADLEEMATDIPSILRNRFRLQALTTEQAREAIEEPARLENKDLTTKQFSYDDKAVDTILKFLNRSETLSDIKSGYSRNFWSWKIIGFLILWIIISVPIVLDIFPPTGFLLLANLLIIIIACIILAFVRPIKPVSASVTSLILLLISLFYLIFIYGDIGDIVQLITSVEFVIVFAAFLLISTIPGIISWRRLKRTIKLRKAQGSFDKNKIEPFQLQLLCQHIEENILPKLLESNPSQKQISVKVEDFGGEPGIQKILESFYSKKVSDVKPKRFRRAVRKLCENGLISPTGRRLPLAEESIAYSYKVAIEVLNQLIEFRLLRKEPKLGSFTYEICHDSMVKPILEAAKNRRRKQIRIGLATLVSLAVITLGFIVNSKIQIQQENEDRNIISTIDSLNKEAGKILNSDTLTITEQRTKLEEIRDSSNVLEKALHSNKFNSTKRILQDKERIDRLISGIDSISKSYASITHQNEFFTDLKYPPQFEELVQYIYQQTDTVYVSAKITYLQNEILRLNWIDNEGVLIRLDSSELKRPDSIIIFNNLFEFPGNYEARLYNSRDYLIGRRTFKIQGSFLLNDVAITILNDISLTIFEQRNKLKENREQAANSPSELYSYVSEQNKFIDKKLSELENAIVRYSTIIDPENFVVCESIERLTPVGISTKFYPGRVYVWSNIKVPKSEGLRLEWLRFNSEGKLIASNKLKVTKSNNYRMYYFRTFSEPGNYEVRLYNSANYLIGRKVFEIIRYSKDKKIN